MNIQCPNCETVFEVPKKEDSNKNINVAYVITYG